MRGILPKLICVCAMLLAADWARGEVRTVTSDLGGLDALTIGADGTIYVSQPNANRVLSIDNGEVEVFLDGLQFPLGHRFDADGNFYASSGTRLVRRGVDGTVTTVASGFSLLAGLTIAADGRIFAADYNTSRIYAITPDGDVEVFSESGELNGPAGIGFDTQGRLYAGNFNDGKIVRMGADGAQSLFAQPDGQVGYVFLRNDTIFATFFASNRVARLDLDGTVTEIAGTGALGSEDGDPALATFRGVNGITASADGSFLLVSEFQPGGGVRRIDIEAESDFEINAAVSGAWFFPETAGSGFLLDADPVSRFLFAAWFTYDDSGAREWLTASGSIEGGLVDATIFETSGGRFDSPSEVTTTPVGAVRFEFRGCADAEVTYVFDDGRSGAFPITRLIPGSEAPCEAIAAGTARVPPPPDQ
ncbi:MAG: hypothetical protein AAGE01_18260 [Pseudomonadota bacterium]